MNTIDGNTDTTLVLTSGSMRTVPLKRTRTNYKKMVVMGFFEEKLPLYTQGYFPHELTEVVTAKQCNNMIAEIDRLRKLCEVNGISTAKPADSWTSENNAYIGSDVEDNGNGVFTAGISCPSWGNVIEAHGNSEEEALALITLVYEALS